MVEEEIGVRRLALPFARRSTRRFREGDFDGGFESFSYAKSMIMYAQEDPAYAQDFFDHLVKEGALGEDIGNMNGREIEPCEHVEECVASNADKQEDNIEQRNHGQHEQERDREHMR